VGLNKDWAGYLFGTGNPLMSRIYDKPAFEGERIVVISSPFLPHRLSEGYSNPMWQVVRSINGNRVKNLENVVEILRDSNDQFIKIEFNKLYGGETIIFPRKEMVAATDEILTDNGIRSQGSADTLAVWNKKPLH
jgi:PDZ domain